MFEPEVAYPLLQRLCRHKAEGDVLQRLCMEWMAAQQPRTSQVRRVENGWV